MALCQTEGIDNNPKGAEQKEQFRESEFENYSWVQAEKTQNKTQTGRGPKPVGLEEALQILGLNTI